MMNADATGRLLKYNATTKQVTVLEDGLPYPNGVAVSYDRTYVVVAHTVPCEVHRFYRQRRHPQRSDREERDKVAGFR
jgi:sugar lactone lactonase YvrE